MSFCELTAVAAQISAWLSCSAFHIVFSTGAEEEFFGSRFVVRRKVGATFCFESSFQPSRGGDRKLGKRNSKFTSPTYTSFKGDAVPMKQNDYGFNIIVHLPSSPDGKAELEKLVGHVHAHVCARNVQNLTCPTEQKQKLVESLIQNVQ